VNAEQLLSNPHASPLAIAIVESWETMVAKFHSEAANGLSIKQVAKVHVHVYGRDMRRADMLPVAKTLAWLERRGFLMCVPDAKGRCRYKARENV
jgi:hypothetical protein